MMTTLLLLALTDAETLRGVGKLSIVIGTVETKVGDAGTWAPAAAGVELEPDTFVKTAPGARAAIDFADGSELRLSGATELQVQGPRKSKLVLGEVYATIKKGETHELTTPFAPMKTEGAVYAAAFIKRDPNSPEYKMVSRTETKLAVFEGKIHVISKRYQQFVTGGYECNLVDAQLNTPDPIFKGHLQTRWTHPILAARGKASDEVAIRANAMLEGLGAVEKDDPCETGLRELGELAAPALAMFVKIPAGGDLPRRRAAARVLGDVAKNPLDLLPTLRDPDAQVRIAGARGLKRLTGEDLGKDEAFWAGDAAATEGWKAWDEKLRKK